MKKSLIALAVLAASGAAMAQSSVTLFGVVDATVRYANSDGAGSLTSLTNSGYNSSRIGFRGTEDLGGGLNASFWLEAGVNNDNGSGAATSTNNQLSGTAAAPTGSQGLTFNRRSTVSLAGTWGELRLGRDYVPFFWNTTIFDPFGTNGVGSVANFTTAGLSAITGVPNITGVRASNSIGYFMPNLSGFYGQAMMAFGENTQGSLDQNGDTGSLRVGYANGPFDVAVGWGRTKYAASATLNADYEVFNIGGSYNFGVAKVMALWNQETAVTAAGVSVDHNVYLIGGSMPLGAGEIKASYTWGKADNNLVDGDMFAIGYVYNLSKRTALYTTYSYNTNDGARNYNTNGLAITQARGSAYGLDFGVKHSF